jgi:hypothetical protein
MFLYLSLLSPQYFTRYVIAIGEYKFPQNMHGLLCLKNGQTIQYTKINALYHGICSYIAFYKFLMYVMYVIIYTFQTILLRLKCDKISNIFKKIRFNVLNIVFLKCY